MDFKNRCIGEDLRLWITFDAKSPPGVKESTLLLSHCHTATAGQFRKTPSAISSLRSACCCTQSSSGEGMFKLHRQRRRRRRRGEERRGGKGVVCKRLRWTTDLSNTALSAAQTTETSREKGKRCEGRTSLTALGQTMKLPPGTPQEQR
mmetsp:Transcript_35153/g.74799  ORF Transcript_35153/g.74799 Transcript_35153/m.74799 type:complete len:149 (+) Transcript_35153:27-473(+)